MSFLKKGDHLPSLVTRLTGSRYSRMDQVKQPLKVQSCKLYNDKYMIASIQITNTEIFAFITVLVFKLLQNYE